MSFAGITFAGQKVLPSADALLMQSILSDGILHGCALSASGFTLTMAAGSLILRGRSFLHTASESWAVDGATSGFARLVVTIDLSKTSTVDAFEQIETDVEYASTANGFATLEQSEINVSGTKYQTEICTVALSSGGITGIVRKIAPAVLADVFSLTRVGTRIPQNADLDTYLTPGSYYCESGTIAGTLANTPFTSYGFRMLVFQGYSKRIHQIAFGSSNVIKFRTYTGTTWVEGWGSTEQPTLTSLLANGYMVASSYQLVDSVDDIPANAPVGSVFLVPME